MDLSRLESPSHTECRVPQTHPGRDQSCSVLCLYLEGLGPFSKVKEGPVRSKGSVMLKLGSRVIDDFCVSVNMQMEDVFISFDFPYYV